MAKLNGGIVDGQPGHAGLHNEERAAHNLNDDAIIAAKARADAAHALATSKFTLPALGIPESLLTAAVQALLRLVASLLNVTFVEWKGDIATVRPTSDPKIYVVWIKRDPAHADPPTDATHMLAGKDILLRATSG